MILRHIDLVLALALLAIWISLASLATAGGRQGGHAMRGNPAADCPPSATCETPSR
jgi:hypothetical protein